MKGHGTVVGCALLVGCAASVDPPRDASRWGAGAKVLDVGCGTYTSVQDAIDDALDGDTIEVCAGTWTEQLSIVGKALTLVGPDGPALTVIDAEGLGRALSISGGADVTLEGLTLTGGVTNDRGGNLWCADSALEVVDAVFTDGSASSGGGLGALNCAGAVRDSRFVGNTATWNGGGAWIEGDVFDLDLVTFEGNAATDGGGAYLRGDGDVTGCTFDGNAAGLSGGGLYVDDGAGAITDNLVVGNTSMDDGAGVALLMGANLVSGNTFEANDSEDEGGGLRVKLSWDAVVTGNTFRANHASYRGGGAKVSHGAIALSDNMWLENTAYQAGALLLYESDSSLTRERFGFNAAERGGAIEMIAGWDETEVVDSLFVGNEATDGDGGHIYAEKAGERVELVRTVFRDGVADDGRGGAIFASDTEVWLSSVTIHRNSATVAGGGLYLDTATGSLTHTIFAENDAPSGAAIELANGLVPVSISSAFVGAHGAGPAVTLASGVAPTVAWCGFFANASDFAGMSSAIGVDGNFAAQPLFTAPSAGDFRLRAGSPLIDAGDPAVSDPDGTRADVGAHGGPDAG